MFRLAADQRAALEASALALADELDNFQRGELSWSDVGMVVGMAVATFAVRHCENEQNHEALTLGIMSAALFGAGVALAPEPDPEPESTTDVQSPP